MTNRFLLKFIGDQRAESHQRWSTGMLYDNVTAENSGIDFRNLGSMESGHGWSMGWGVAWNYLAQLEERLGIQALMNIGYK
jgi:hypothetical protein